LITQIGPDVPSEVLGDPLRLRQVISNLLNNALKFTEEGEVIVGVRVRHRSPWHVDLEIRVSDTGLGISEERAQSIFRPFSQADASTTRRYGGTGLGLPICRQLVELMGGDLRLESTPGEGSTFYFGMRFELEEKLSEELKAVTATTGRAKRSALSCRLGTWRHRQRRRSTAPSGHFARPRLLT
ncbi:MAG: hypothetical protein JRD94_16000, partial [Deltaproteobacteria bacterium]|nr:hypothetical protein [Deltaproteobacteria bacterium]